MAKTKGKTRICFKVRGKKTPLCFMGRKKSPRRKANPKVGVLHGKPVGDPWARFVAGQP